MRPLSGTRGEASLARAVQGRNVVLTGASSGIGRAFALRLAAVGASPVLISRRRDELAGVAAQMRDLGGEARLFPANLSESADVQRVAEAILGELGSVDILVNNAGSSIRRPVERSYGRMRDFERTINLNYLGALGLILAFLPGMRQRGSGHVVNVSSAGTQSSMPLFSAYNASKSALDAWSRTVAAELAGTGVRISTVYMPLVATAMTAGTRAYAGARLQTPEDGADLLSRALVTRDRRVAPWVATLGELMSVVSPSGHGMVMGAAYRRVQALEAVFSRPGAIRSARQRRRQALDGRPIAGARRPR